MKQAVWIRNEWFDLIFRAFNFRNIIFVQILSHDPEDSVCPIVLRSFLPCERCYLCCVHPGHGQSIRHGDELTHDTIDPADSLSNNPRNGRECRNVIMLGAGLASLSWCMVTSLKCGHHNANAMLCQCSFFGSPTWIECPWLDSIQVEFKIGSSQDLEGQF